MFPCLVCEGRGSTYTHKLTQLVTRTNRETFIRLYTRTLINKNLLSCHFRSFPIVSGPFRSFPVVSGRFQSFPVVSGRFRYYETMLPMGCVRLLAVRYKPR